MQIPEMSNMDDAALNGMSEVKIWRPKHSFPANPANKKSNETYEKTGPFYSDSS